MTDDQSAKRAAAKRELEQAPLLLRKAAQILAIGALFPFYTAVRFAATAAEKVGPSRNPLALEIQTEGFAWGPWLLAKAICLVGFWFAYEGCQAASGVKPKSPLMSLAKNGKMVPLLIGVVCWVIAIVLAAQSSVLVVERSGEIAEVFKLGLIAEVGTLALALFAIVHIFNYEHGGKFNPIVPIMFVGPALAGILNLGAAGGVFGNPHSGLGALGLIGSVIVAIGGCYAIWILYRSMKEAQVTGKARALAEREARKAEREKARSTRPKSEA